MSQISFGVGYRFYYWNYYKTNTSTDIQPIDNKYDHGGYDTIQLYIERKYESLKDELTNNKQYCLALHGFKMSYIKAQKFMETIKVKKILARIEMISMFTSNMVYPMVIQLQLIIYYL